MWKILRLRSLQILYIFVLRREKPYHIGRNATEVFDIIRIFNIIFDVLHAELYAIYIEGEKGVVVITCKYCNLQYVVVRLRN